MILLEAKKQQEGESSAKKTPRVYNRVTPTIKAILNNEKGGCDLSLFENLMNSTKAFAKKTDETLKRTEVIRDVHDEIGETFDFACTKAAYHHNIPLADDQNENSNDLSLEDICIKKDMGHNNENSSSSDDYGEFFSVSNLDNKASLATKQQKNPSSSASSSYTALSEENASTRTLRSRTVSQRKIN